MAQGAGPCGRTWGAALINLQDRLQGHRHLAAQLASDIILYAQARTGPIKSRLKSITNRSAFLDLREHAWGGWVASEMFTGITG